MKHIKLLNKGEEEAPLPGMACTTDLCHIYDAPGQTCPAIDLCWMDYVPGCSEKDECTWDG